MLKLFNQNLFKIVQFRTPKFWSSRNLISLILLPWSLVYFVISTIKYLLQKPYKISKPVICVGNLIAGGSGKTPVAIALGKILREIAPSDFEFAYLSTGYMGDGSKFVALREGKHVAKNVGDEPMLLVKTAPTFVAKKRLFGAQQIDNIRDVKAIILDDGMQNNSLYKDLVILVIDAKIAFGNGLIIPAGPMREMPWTGLRKADFVVVVGQMKADLEKSLAGKKVVQAHHVLKNIEDFRGKKLMAFCGLAYPQKFFSLLKENNLEVLNETSFPDHYSYTESDLKTLFDASKEKGLTPITTQKDWVKFPPEYQREIGFLDLELEFLDKEFVLQELRKIIKL